MNDPKWQDASINTLNSAHNTLCAQLAQKLRIPTTHITCIGKKHNRYWTFLNNITNEPFYWNGNTTDSQFLYPFEAYFDYKYNYEPTTEPEIQSKYLSLSDLWALHTRHNPLNKLGLYRHPSEGNNTIYATLQKANYPSLNWILYGELGRPLLLINSIYRSKHNIAKYRFDFWQNYSKPDGYALHLHGQIYGTLQGRVKLQRNKNDYGTRPKGTRILL